ncbi:MAG: GntP family permease [Sedimentisphaerales bacterium]|nr:GntP family permease [Sedimentisphaerales bacterium]
MSWWIGSVEGNLVKERFMWLVILLLLSIIFIIVSTTRLRLHPFLSLLLAAFGYGICSGTMSLADVVASVNGGFGDTIGKIGIVILAGAIIGVFLEKSGGARNLAEQTLRLVGQKNVPLAMSIIGYIVSIPVFCDSGFVILAPLAKALSRRAKASLAAGAIALSLGLYSTHTMVPPTPGPIAAAGILKADLGLVILWGVLVSLAALAAGWLFAVKYAARTTLAAESETPAALEPASQGPSAAKAIVPILFPIVLIVLKSVSAFPSHPFGEATAARVIGFVGEPVVALLFGVLLAFLLPERLSLQMLSASGWVGEGMMAAATIILITGCGGAFGKVLQSSGIADVVAGHLGRSTSLSLLLPFLIAAGLKTAQGSSTVAIITTAGILSPLLEILGLQSETTRALTVVAIGAGSMVVSHANDSYFWVVTGFTKMTVNQGYRLQTLGTFVEGCAAAVALWVLSLVVL